MSSRRAFLKRSTAAASLAAVGPARAATFLPAYPRVAIIGGGLAGVSCAWLLDGVAESVVFERRGALGGHAETIAVDVFGQAVEVDVGAQFFAANPHPTYTRLMEHVGLLTPGSPATDLTVDAEMTITVLEAGRFHPRFVSPASDRTWPYFAGWNLSALLGFLGYILAARALEDSGDWSIALDDWLGGLAIAPDVRANLLLPLLSALVGCTIEQARRLAARNANAFVVQALPANVFGPIRYSNSLIGLGGNVEYLAGLSATADCRTGTEVTAVWPAFGGGYWVRSGDDRTEFFDAVVFAAPPYVSAPLLRFLPWHRRAARLMEQLEFFPSEISIHRDPAYMPFNRDRWSAYNAIRRGPRCEGSVWYGALRPPGIDCERLQLFKSWATDRFLAPREEVYRRRFRHPLVTPEFIVTQRRLADVQGRANVWFAGSWTLELDSQETALRSAINVVEQLAPHAPNLAALA